MMPWCAYISIHQKLGSNVGKLASSTGAWARGTTSPRPQTARVPTDQTQWQLWKREALPPTRPNANWQRFGELFHLPHAICGSPFSLCRQGKPEEALWPPWIPNGLGVSDISQPETSCSSRFNAPWTWGYGGCRTPRPITHRNVKRSVQYSLQCQFICKSPKFWSCKSARCHQGTHHPNNPPQQRGSVLHPQLERQIPRCLTDSAGTTINISPLLSIARISSTKCLPKKLVWFWGILRGRSPTHQRLTNASLPFVIHHNTTPLNTDQTAQATTVECHISWQCEHKTFAKSYMMSRDRSVGLGRNSNIVHTHTMFFCLGDHVCNPQREV